MIADFPESLKAWISENFPGMRFAYWGQSAATMLHDALREEQRNNVILPAFICPSVTAAAIQAGKHVVHVDVDRTTLHIDPQKLEQVLRGMRHDDTVLLIDHSFGYPYSQIEKIRQDHPGLLIIEDCVRALGGATTGGPVGRSGDWVLVSLYKTVGGNDHGGILLTGSPYTIRSGRVRPTTLRQFAATFGPARMIYERLKRRSCNYSPSRRDLESPPLKPVVGIPNQLCLTRFLTTITKDKKTLQRRQEATRDIRSALQGTTGFSFIKSAKGVLNAEHFVSFTVDDDGARDRLISDLHRQGLFLLRTWDCIPPFFRTLTSTFPTGCSVSVFLADHVVHIPMNSFLSRSLEIRHF